MFGFNLLHPVAALFFAELVALRLKLFLQVLNVVIHGLEFGLFRGKLLLQSIQLFLAFIGVGDGFLNADNTDFGYRRRAGTGGPGALGQCGSGSAHSKREGEDADIFMT